MTEKIVGEQLSDEALARRSRLPVSPDPVVLEGRFVRLEPLDVDRDTDALFAVSNGEAIHLDSRSVDAYDSDELIWRYLGFGPFDNADDFRAYLQVLAGTQDSLPMTVFDRDSGHQVGIATFMSNVPGALKIELGNIWYSPVVQGTPANTEATYLMLRHAFDLGYRRLEWKCNALNQRSRRAAERMGFRFEGVQEAHLIVKDRNRDTAWFRILDHEWPTVRASLESTLAGWG